MDRGLRILYRGGSLDDGRKPFSDRFGLPAQRLLWDAAPLGFRHAVVDIPLGEHLLSRDEVVGAVRLGWVRQRQRQRQASSLGSPLHKCGRRMS
jgi:hypothetical protein